MKINKVDFENFDKEIILIIKKSKLVRKSIDDALSCKESVRCGAHGAPQEVEVN